MSDLEYRVTMRVRRAVDGSFKTQVFTEDISVADLSVEDIDELEAAMTNSLRETHFPLWREMSVSEPETV